MSVPIDDMFPNRNLVEDDNKQRRTKLVNHILLDYRDDKIILHRQMLAFLWIRSFDNDYFNENSSNMRLVTCLL